MAHQTGYFSGDDDLQDIELNPVEPQYNASTAEDTGNNDRTDIANNAAITYDNGIDNRYQHRKQRVFPPSNTPVYSRPEPSSRDNTGSGIVAQNRNIDTTDRRFIARMRNWPHWKKIVGILITCIFAAIVGIVIYVVVRHYGYP